MLIGKGCVNVSWLLERLSVEDASFHPLLTLNPTFKNCGLVLPEHCRNVKLPSRFLELASESLYKAENAISDLLGVSPCLREECERVEYPRHQSRCNCEQAMRQKTTNRWKSVKLRKNLYRTAGKFATEHIDSALVRYIDVDGDGFREIAEVSTPSNGYVLNRIYAYYGLSRIAPVLERSDDGTNITLRFNSWDMILPRYLKTPITSTLFSDSIPKTDVCCEYDSDGYIVSTDSDCPFIQSVELYIVRIDTNCPVKLYGEEVGNDCGDTNDCELVETPACVQASGVCNTIRLVPAVEKGGICTPASYCPCTMKEPVYAIVNYIGGCPDCDMIMPNLDQVCYEDALYELALSWLDWSSCDCEPLTKVGERQIRMESRYHLEMQLAMNERHPRFRSIVRNDLIGEYTAWGILKALIGRRC